MHFEKTEIKDCYLITPKVFEDERGYFFESFNWNEFLKATKIDKDFIQDNQSKSKYGVIRGLHAQKGEYAQAKLVRVLEGEVYDVAVDARKNSPSYGKIVKVKLTADNKKQLYIPRGCLHGFSVISKNAVFSYKCDNVYNKASEIGVNPLDNSLNIDWGIISDLITLSEKDEQLPNWIDFIK